MLVHLSEVTKIPVNDLIYTYGLYFFKTIESQHAYIFQHYTSPIDFVSSIENHIHVQVKKIYPDAELPSFKIVSKNTQELQLIYSSERAMYMFAKALMEKTFEYYKNNVEIKFKLLNEKGTRVMFNIKIHGNL